MQRFSCRADGRPLQHGPVRHSFEFDDGPQIRGVDEQLHDATIVQLLELIKHEAGEQLVLGELLEAEAMGGGWQDLACGDVGRLQQLPHRLGGIHEP